MSCVRKYFVAATDKRSIIYFPHKQNYNCDNNNNDNDNDNNNNNNSNVKKSFLDFENDCIASESAVRSLDRKIKEGTGDESNIEPSIIHIKNCNFLNEYLIPIFEEFNNSKLTRELVLTFIGHGKVEEAEGENGERTVSYVIQNPESRRKEEYNYSIKYLVEWICWYVRENNIRKPIFVILDQCYAYKVFKNCNSEESRRCPSNLEIWSTSSENQEKTYRKYELRDGQVTGCRHVQLEEIFKNVLIPLIRIGRQTKYNRLEIASD
jgi:hypothetical protein